jgi:hypothetical protein
MRVVVFTAAIGDTDIVRPPKTIDPNAEYLCFTDRPSVVAPYERIGVPSTSDGMLAARRIKVLADHPRLTNAEVTLWHDASYALRRNLTWLRRAIRWVDLVALAHPRRSRLEDEALAIARYGYLPTELALSHVARYRAAGFDRDGITASGLLGRRVSSTVSEFNALWWRELQQWGGRDQGSLDYSAWASGLRVGHVPGTIRDNRMAQWRIYPAAVSA